MTTETWTQMREWVLLHGYLGEDFPCDEFLSVGGIPRPFLKDDHQRPDRYYREIPPSAALMYAIRIGLDRDMWTAEERDALTAIMTAGNPA
jgi:hypothetical protein